MVSSIADTVCRRMEAGKNFGVIIIPEGCINGMSDIKLLLDEIGAKFAAGKSKASLFVLFF